MTRYDDVVVGSGISGMTAALLLGLANRRVLLIERGGRLGGSLSRFRRNDIPFDTGFHFTGGLDDEGLLSDMLRIMGMRDAIVPVFLAGESSNRFVFEREEEVFDFPYGFDRLVSVLSGYFPGERRAVERYFEMVRDVCTRSGRMDLRGLNAFVPTLDEDLVSLQSVLDGLTDNVFLKALLSGYCMCYGTKPVEVSFANHCRICVGMYQSVAKIRGGGDALINAFQDRLRSVDVDVVCHTHITECREVSDRRVGRVVLNTGEEIAFERALFTMHPEEIVKILPREHLSKAFLERVAAFESSMGFFCAFGVLDARAVEADFESTVISLFPSTDVNHMLDTENLGASALVVFGSNELVNGETRHAVVFNEPVSLRCTEMWKDSVTGRRPPEYTAYKARIVARMRERLGRFSRGCVEHLDMLDSATPLTFRDYLHSPEGAAYGIRQKVGQYNLVGKLPFRNLFVAGQCAVLPGIVGAMLSSFVVTRAMMGRADFDRLAAQGIR